MRFVSALLLALVAFAAAARGVYQAPEAFLREAFAERVPPARVLWLDDQLQRQIAEILGHRYSSLRLRYWRENGRSAWILEEIGKEEPITTGIIVKDGKIELVKVLIFRESRGDEVRYPFFTQQFTGASLRSGAQLDRTVDGISGATLSVRALKKLARLALFLDKAVRERELPREP